MKKALFGLLSLSILLFYCIIIIKDYMKHTDISIYPVKHIHKERSKEKTWLISYADGDSFIQSQNNLSMSASMTQAFDVVISYQPHNIDPQYYEKHKEILAQKRGVGYWLWKPYLILETLKIMPENDILLYADRTAIFRDGIYEVLALAKEHDITLFPNYHTNRQFMKKLLVNKMEKGDQAIRDKIQLEASFLLLRNNSKTREFIKEWLSYCEDPELLTDIPSDNEYPEFIDHRHDQAILSALYHKNPKRYHLYQPYPARKNAFFLTRRNFSNNSLLSITFNKQLGNFNWTNRYLINLRNLLIGRQKNNQE